MEIFKQFRAQEVMMGRLSYGEDIITALESFCREQSIQAGWVTMIGAVKKATLSYYDQVTHQYHAKAFDGEFEIISCTGNISLRNQAPAAHLHMALSDTQYGCIAGHLVAGSTEVFACEFALTVLQGDDWLVRGQDPQTGLPLW